MMKRFLTLTALALPAAFVLTGALPVAAQDLDIESVFNCAEDGPLGDQTPEQCLEARTILFNNCTSCHSFVPIVKAQKTQEAWDTFLATHRERVSHVSDDQFQILGDFLRSHYNDVEPVPILPPALEALSTNQPA